MRLARFLGKVALVCLLLAAVMWYFADLPERCRAARAAGPLEHFFLYGNRLVSACQFAGLW